MSAQQPETRATLPLGVRLGLEDAMATFVMLTTLTDEGAKTLMHNPERVTKVNEELANMGAHVVEQWAVLGLYDFVNIVEAPDVETMARVSAHLASRGTVRVQTLSAVPIGDFINSFTISR